MAITHTVTESWVTYEFIWHTAMDDRVCKQKCVHLEGQSWTGERLNGILVHPMFGPVYDLDADAPLTHPNCRCFLEVRPIVELEKTEGYKSLETIFVEVRMEMPSNIQEATAQVDKLRVNVGQCRDELREFEYILYRTISVMSKMGLPPETEQAIQKFERMILIARILHSTLIYIEMGTPFGQIVGIISGLSAALSALNLMQDLK